MRNSKKQTKLHGFSLFEVLVTLGVLLMLSGLVFPFTIQKVQQSKLENHASQLVSDIFFQQQESYYKNSPRGIAFSSNGYTIYDGESLASSTESSYKAYPNNIQIHSVNFFTGTEFNFPEGEFKPSSSGDLIITDGFNSIKIYINREGLIYYEII
jgi:Tfp pilus assembly protein FimT